MNCREEEIKEILDEMIRVKKILNNFTPIEYDFIKIDPIEIIKMNYDMFIDFNESKMMTPEEIFKKHKEKKRFVELLNSLSV